VLIAVYLIILMGCVGVSFLSFLDVRFVNTLIMRIITLVGLGLVWWEPISIIGTEFNSWSGMPGILVWLGPVLVLLPFFYTTFMIFGEPWVERMRPGRKRVRVTGDYPKARQAELAEDYEGAFAAYRDHYLRQNPLDSLLWERMGRALLRFKDRPSAADAIIEIVRSARDEDQQVNYALAGCDTMHRILRQTDKAVMLLKSLIPMIQDPRNRTLLEKKLESISQHGKDDYLEIKF
jgi:hypothetical protein